MSDVSSDPKQPRRSECKFVDTTLLELKDVKSEIQFDLTSTHVTTRKGSPVDVRETETVSSEEDEKGRDMEEGVEESVVVPQFQFAEPKSVSSSRKARGKFCVDSSAL